MTKEAPIQIVVFVFIVEQKPKSHNQLLSWLKALLSGLFNLFGS